jgi:hypothetical protein
MPHTIGIGAIFGIVSEDGVAKSGGRIGLYDRSTMQLVKKTTADALGGYVFTGLDPTTTDYLVLAVDDDGSPAKNALVQDYIQPIPAHMGSSWLGNWRWLAGQKAVIGMAVPHGETDQTVSRSVYPAYGPPINNTGSVTWYESSMTPGAPQYPTAKFTGYAYFPTRHYDAAQDSVYADPTKFSLEWVCDTAVGQACHAVKNQTAMSGWGQADMLFIAIGLSWDRTSKTMTWVFNKQTAYNYYSFNLTETNHYTTGTYTNAGLADGAHHWVATLEMGVALKLYLDGALVHTTSLVGQITVPNSLHGGYWRQYAILFCGNGSAPTGQTPVSGTNFTTGPAAWYRATLSAAEVLDLYNALMIGSSPLLTGYARDVISDDPSIYVRMDSATATTESELIWRDTVTWYGSVTGAQASPVTGGSMMAFAGGCARAEGPGGPLSKLRNTIEFWINPTSATPAATGLIAAGRWNSDDSTVNWQITQVITTGKIQAYVRRNTGAYDTVTFNYAPAAGSDVLVAIVLDKYSGSATIYENGVLKDTQSIGIGYFYNTDMDATSSFTNWTKSTLCIGGFRSDAGVITTPFAGNLAELAVYPTALSAARILSHYESRTLI